MRVAIDIETAPGLGFETYEDAALDFNRNRITLIATWDGTSGRIFRSVEECDAYLETLPAGTQYIFHHGKFDLKTLKKKGSRLLGLTALHHDTSLMGLALSEKIPDSWMVAYGVRRKAANEAAGSNVHRDAGPNSLKTLAPYHLNVAPFWEVADHNDETYALKDAEYTWRLSHVLEEKLRAEGTWDFYERHLLPWARLIMRTEWRGITIDNELMRTKEEEAAKGMAEAERQLDVMWEGAHAAYRTLQENQVRTEYERMTQAAIARIKAPTTDKIVKTTERYRALTEKALAKIEPKINLGSPDQLSWLLKDHLQLDITTFNGKEESTAKPVLQRLAGTRPDVRTFLQYRSHAKLINAFFPSYREMQVRGILHCSFNLDIARTGRLSSSGPNLQQVPGHLHALFRARPGHKLLCYDLSAIEPTVIAFLTEDPILCDLLINGGNFHSNNVRIFLNIDATDAEIKEKYKNERAMVKEVALALFYGAGAERIRESAQKFGFTWSKQQCRDIHQRFKDRYQTVFAYKRQLDRVLERGGSMQNVLGRVLRIPNPADVYMTGFNTLVQSSASDMLLDAARRADEAMPGKIHPLLFVHDEFIPEVAEADVEQADRVVKAAMEAFKLPTSYGMVPVVAEGGISDVWKKG